MAVLNFSSQKEAIAYKDCPENLKQTIMDALDDCSQGRESGSGDEFYIPVRDTSTYFSSGQGEPEAPYYYVGWELNEDLNYLIDSIDLVEGV